jgi:hypothetical protein
VEEFSRPIRKKARSVERPTSHRSKSLPFVDTEFTLPLGMQCDENTVSVLQGNRSQVPVLPLHPSASLVMPEPIGKFLPRYHDGCHAKNASPQHCAHGESVALK